MTNAVDHGCESAEVRIAAGKDPIATVTVDARSAGSTVVIEVSDDGAGIDEAVTHGARLRLRPIIMTATATIFALLPMAVGLTGGNGFISKSLAVVVIGGMGSIMGAIVTGFGLGIVEGLTKVFYPEASNTVIFVIMVIVLLLKPAGLFGKER